MIHLYAGIQRKLGGSHVTERIASKAWIDPVEAWMVLFSHGMPFGRGIVHHPYTAFPRWTRILVPRTLQCGLTRIASPSVGTHSAGMGAGDGCSETPASLRSPLVLLCVLQIATIWGGTADRWSPNPAHRWIDFSVQGATEERERTVFRSVGAEGPTHTHPLRLTCDSILGRIRPVKPL